MGWDDFPCFGDLFVKQFALTTQCHADGEDRLLNASLPVQGEDDRTAVRRRLLVSATYDAHPDGLTDLTVHDLSRTGVLFEADADLPPLSLITLHLPVVGAREARLIWSGGRYRGAEFILPLTQSSVQAVYDRSTVVWPAFSPARGGGIDDRNAIETLWADESLEVAENPSAGLSPSRKIQSVVLLATTLWLALVVGARSLTA